MNSCIALIRSILWYKMSNPMKFTRKILVEVCEVVGISPDHPFLNLIHHYFLIRPPALLSVLSIDYLTCPGVVGVCQRRHDVLHPRLRRRAPRSAQGPGVHAGPSSWVLSRTVHVAPDRLHRHEVLLVQRRSNMQVKSLFGQFNKICNGLSIKHLGEAQTNDNFLNCYATLSGYFKPVKLLTLSQVAPIALEDT